MKKRMTRSAVMLLGLIIAIGAWIGYRPLTKTVSAGTGGYTADSAIEWVRSQTGKQLDYDGAYYGECVDLINVYAKTLGQGYCYGNAKDYASNNISAWKGWTRIKGATPQKGDILIWTGGQWGHVAIYENSNTTWHQNYNYKKTVQKVTGAYNNIGLTGYWGVIRPDFPTQPSNPLPTPIKDATIQNGVYVLKNVGSGRAMNYSYGISNPNPIQLCTYGDENANEQHFKFVHEGNGKYRIEIQHKDGGLVNCECQLPVTSGVKLTGRKDCHDDTQRFYITKLSDNTYVFRNAYDPNLVIGAVSSGNFANLTMQIYDSNNKLQLWSFNPLANTPTPSPTNSPTPTPVALPSAPSNVKAVPSSTTSITVSWNAVSGASGYQVWRRSTASGSFTSLGTYTTTSKVSTGLESGKIYYYKVRAYKLVNGEKYYGSFSSVVSMTTKVAKPENVKAVSASATSVKITWDAVSGATGYQVCRATSENGSYSILGYYTTTSKISKALTTGTKYFYKVRAYKEVNGERYFGAYADVVSAIPKPSKPSNVKAAVSSATAVTVSWNEVDGATGYEVYRCETSNGTYVKLGTLTGTSRKCPGLTSGKTYYFKVRAYTTVDGTKIYGNYSSVVSATPKK